MKQGKIQMIDLLKLVFIREIGEEEATQGH